MELNTTHWRFFQAKFKYLCKNVISIFIANNEICVRCTV